MSVVIKGIYENGQVLLTKPTPTAKKVSVNIVFYQDAAEVKERELKRMKLGLAALPVKSMCRMILMMNWMT